MATDLTKLSSEQVLSLINDANGSSLTFDEIQFDIPETLVDDTDGKNTSLLVQSRPNGGYSGDVTVKYDRLDLNGFRQYGEPVLELPPNNSALTDVVEAFNVLYDANLSAEDDIASNVVIPEIGYADTEMTLTASDDSLAFRGAIDIIARWRSEVLSEVILNRAYDGLDWPTLPLDGIVENLSVPAFGTYTSAGAVCGDSLYLDGGQVIGANSRNLLRQYDFLTNTWLETTSQATRSGSALASIDDKLYLFGGNTSNRTRYSIYDTTTSTWTNGSEILPVDFTYTSSTAVGRDIYLFGSSAAPGQLYKYNIDDDTFTRLADCPIPLNSGGMDFYNGKLYAAGGVGAGTQRYDNLLSYDISTDSWTELAPMPRGASYIDLVTVGGYIYTFGGNGMNSVTYNNLLRYDPASDSWFDYGDIGVGPRYRYKMVGYQNNIYLYGGLSGTGNSTVQNSFVKIS